MTRLAYAALCLLGCVLVACSDAGNAGGPDAAPDLALPPQVTHLGVGQAVCCIETTPTNWRVMYLSSPKPGGGTNGKGLEIATKGDLHLADAYGADMVLASNVPRGGYLFSGDGRFVMFLAQSAANDGTYALKLGALSADTLGAVNPTIVIPRGLLNQPFALQSFFSPSGRYLVIGVTEKGIAYSSDLTVVEVETGKVVGTLPGGGSFNYFESVAFNDVLVYENSTASKTLGTPSVVGLYAQPLSTVGAKSPALIDTRPVSFSIAPDQRRVLYTRYDGNLWMYDLHNQSRVLLLSGVVAFSVGNEANGPIVWVDGNLAVHVTPILKLETTATAAGATTVHSSFLFSPSQQDLYFFNKGSVQNNEGDLFRLDLRPGHITGKPQEIDHAVSQADFTFIGERVRYIRNLDGRGDVGELVSAMYDGSDLRSIAFGVPTGSLQISAPRPVQPTYPKGNPPRGSLDFATPVIPPVYAHLVNAARDTSINTPLFDDSQPIVGSLAFSRDEESIQILDPAVHVGGYQFSPDGYVLVYAGGATLNTQLEAYLGTLRLYQTLVDQAPVPPMLSGVSEVSPIRDRAFFAAAPGASPPGVYFIRY